MRGDASGFRPKRRWGQNFLVNQGAADLLVAGFAPRPDDLVLEVGPGRGVLTRRLLGRVARIAAVEVDPLLAAGLRRDLASPAAAARGGAATVLEVIEADILGTDLRRLLLDLGAAPARSARVLANLPYNIATAVILRLLDEAALLRDMMVMVQREVAARLLATPDTRPYGSLTVLCQARAAIDSILRLRPGSFRPVPLVESEVVRLTLLPGAAGPADAALAALLRTGFGHRRKTLLNNLARLRRPGGGALGAAGATDLIRSAGLQPGMRPQEVPVRAWVDLAARLPAGTGLPSVPPAPPRPRGL